DLAQNNELAEAFRLYSSIENTMRSTHGEFSGEDALRQTLKELGAVYFASPKSTTRTNEANKGSTSHLDNAQASDHEVEEEESNSAGAWQPWRRIAVAASIMGIIAISIVWFSR